MRLLHNTGYTNRIVSYLLEMSVCVLLVTQYYSRHVGLLTNKISHCGLTGVQKDMWWITKSCHRISCDIPVFKSIPHKCF